MANKDFGALSQNKSKNITEVDIGVVPRKMMGDGKEGKDGKEMTKFERFAANAMKIKVEGDKNKMLEGLGANLKE